MYKILLLIACSLLHVFIYVYDTYHETVFFRKCISKNNHIKHLVVARIQMGKKKRINWSKNFIGYDVRLFSSVHLT